MLFFLFLLFFVLWTIAGFLAIVLHFGPVLKYGIMAFCIVLAVMDPIAGGGALSGFVFGLILGRIVILLRE